MTNKTAEEIKSDALAAMQDYFPNGGRDWDHINELFDAIRDGKIIGLSVNAKIHDHACTNCFTDQGPCLGECAISDEKSAENEQPTRNQMIEYVQGAIKEGYTSYYGLPANGISWLSDECLKVDYGVAWEYYNLSADESGKHPRRDLGE